MTELLQVLTTSLPDKPGSRVFWKNLPGASKAFVLSQTIQASAFPLLIIAPEWLMIEHIAEALPVFGVPDSQLILFPDWETLPYDHFSPHQDIISQRLAALTAIPYLKSGAILTTVSTLMQRLPPARYLRGHSFSLKMGEKLNLSQFRASLTEAGYLTVNEVREHGEVAYRGSIIDVFPMGTDQPFRLDLFDDEIDSIRYFSVETQRSEKKVAEIKILPAKEFPLTDDAIQLFRERFRSEFSGNPLASPIYQEVTDRIAFPGIEYYLPFFFQETATLFGYLPKNTRIVTINDIQGTGEKCWHEIMMRFEQGRFDQTRPLLKPETLFLPLETLNQHLNSHPRVYIDSPHQKEADITFPFTEAPQLPINHQKDRPLEALENFLHEEKGRILFSVETIGRREILLQLFATQFTQTPYKHLPCFNSWQDFFTSNAHIGLIVTALDAGFTLQSPRLTLLTENHFYQARIMQRRRRKKASGENEIVIRDLTELNIGDTVTHIDHGIGRYLGLEKLSIGGKDNEFVAIAYQGDAKLYVPVSSLHLINRYSGRDEAFITLSKLGTDQWQKAKRKAAEKVRDAAAELLDIYAKREAAQKPAMQLHEADYLAFADSFSFEETPDQAEAIEKVLQDLQSDRPMDRVICGDVGFGKTEVAIRAAFMAVHNKKQVAILVPTTLLAQQHFEHFRNRFADWPITIEMLSRFKTAKEQKIILEKLSQGQIDIIIGTHKLLQNEIPIKSLGLVIIDEEHRFGVKQKEAFKALRAAIDILTLTATPIPRTLNMALAGIRDLSLIATPPAKRLSVKTFLYEYQDQIIKEAVLREIMRGGQVYFLHNDVATIHLKAAELAKLVPEARIAVAHGQMHERELERVMSQFYHRQFNVLICSTIIESGIDIPSANTIIINRADKFGIAALHQLRGRVGRSHHQAYAYLLVPALNSITDEAKKRLDAICKHDELGVGFMLSSHDLEIRGAGELLGEEQSGEIEAVGFTLYMDLLTHAVNALKSGKSLETVDIDFEKSLHQYHAEIDLHLPAFIPDSYLGDVALRLQFYKRIASAKTIEALEDIQIEMIDRFGLLPDIVKTLFAIGELNLEAQRLGISKLEANDKGGKFEFSEKPNIKPETIIKLIQNPKCIFKLEGPTRLKFSLPPHDSKMRIQLVKERMDALKIT